ncbi:MFS transporter [Geomonas nitrogeniifigens]|uniref:MFS transporter n=1 Tax=Geomonas diazotrophica TaxID=2843197 RepID=A0ABX8JI01_9BACT|nr:MFS transporter [Geomonas nitrogeniifigens]QWV98005.1 MFS transporter [Geomonas nitrogeniifigens]
MTSTVETADFRQSVLRHQPFRLFWLARVCSSVALQMQAVAVGWQIYALTGSVFYLGLVGLAQFLPMFLLTLAVGHVADRYDRRRIAGTCQVLEGMALVLLALGSYGGWLGKDGILAVVFAAGALRAFEGPTMLALVPWLVPQELIPRASAWSASANQTASIAGPALGGLLYALGPTTVYTTAAVLFFAASLLLSRIRLDRAPVKREPATVRSLFAGIAFIRSRQEILGAISLDLFAVLLGGATALLPVFARDILHTGPLGLGMLRAAPAMGALGVSLLLARRPLRQRVGRTMFLSVFLFGVATVVFGISTSFPISMAALMVLGAADIVSVVIRASLVQIETPDEMRGRVSAVNSMFIGTSNQLGEFESGVTAALFGTVPAVLIGGVGTMVVVLLWMRLFPRLLQVDKLGE